ncbi:MAG: hypothetical protein ACXVCO_12380 [Ktedonobacterales bacterium]
MLQATFGDLSLRGLTPRWCVTTGPSSLSACQPPTPPGVVCSYVKLLPSLYAVLSTYVNRGQKAPGGAQPGTPTRSITPLNWSMAEYVVLLVSASQGRITDIPSIVQARYAA